MAAQAVVPGVAEARDPGRPWLGVELAPRDGGGVFAKRVLRGSPADKAGVKDNDDILKVGASEVAVPRDVIKTIAQAGVGATIAVRVRRAGTERDVPVLLSAHPGDEEVLKLDKVGSFAPTWKGVLAAQGTTTDIKQLRGRVVLVDFWASWCVACRLTAPELNALHDRFGAQGLTVVGLTDDAEDVALRAASKLGIKYSIGAATSSETLSAYGVRALPTMFFVDKKGVIRDVVIGAGGQAELALIIQKLLKEPA